MNQIRTEVFNGIMPILAPKLLPPNAAQVAQNVDLSGHRLTPWQVPLLTQAIPAGQKTFYKWRRNNSYEWLTWNTDVDVVQSPIAEDQFSRIYFTGSDIPKVIGWAGGQKVQRNMSLPPATAPTATVVDRVAVNCNLIVYASTAQGPYLTGGFPMTLAPINTTDKDGQRTWKYHLEYKVPDLSGAGGLAFFNVGLQLDFGALGQSPGSKDFSLNYPIDVPLMDDIVQVGELTVVNVDKGIQAQPIGGTQVWEPTVTVDFGYVDNSTKYVYYVQTLVDDWGQEGPPSNPSNEVVWGPGKKVELTNFGSSEGMTSRRFYRSVAGTSQDAFEFLVELPAGDTFQFDSTADAALGEVIPQFENPPDDLTGLVMMPGGWAVGFHGREVCPSDPDYPWSYPTDYRFTVDYDIVGLGVAGNDLYVLTAGTPYRVSGYHPESLTVAKLTIPYSCVAKRSIVTMGDMIAYASPDGLVGISNGTPVMLTEKFYGRPEWQALNPTTMMSAFYDGAYYGFCSGVGIICRFSEGADTITTTDQLTTGLYADLIDDTLYIIQGSAINAWDRGATNLTMLWQGKLHPYDIRAIWTSGRIVADAYPVTLRVYRDGVDIVEIVVTSERAFRLPKILAGREWSISVQSTAGVDLLSLASGMKTLRLQEQI